MSDVSRDHTELEKIQLAIFSASACRSSEGLPKELHLLAVPNDISKKDLEELHSNGLIVWNANLKSSTFGTPVSNPRHMISCTAYYCHEDSECPRFKCIGYAIGCINEELQAVEIDYIEKRKDSPEELRSKFLHIMVDAYASYALYLNSRVDGFNINKFVFVGPLEDKIVFYQKRGFEIIESYRGSCRAAVKYLTDI